MAPNYYSIEKAAEVLGVTVDEVKQLRERRELYGYRDGATWKFKADDVERLAAERQESGEGEDAGDVLLSDLSLGHSSPSSSGTVIGMDAELSGLSDIKLSVAEGKGPGDSNDTQAMDALDLKMESDVDLLGGSDVRPDSKAGSGSDIELGGEDSDQVLGGSSGGSDVTIGGDSGIHLIDPADSGLSLEEPLELGGGEESLELEEDDMLALSDASGEAKGDDDFLLTPVAESGDEDDSESGSQVIALDGDSVGEEGFGLAGSGAPMALLDDEGGTAPSLELAPAAVMVGGTVAVAAMAPGAMQMAAIEPSAEALALASAPEAPWSAIDIVLLAVCMVVLVVGGILAYDLTRNVTQYGGAGSISSVLMDTVANLLGG